ncbi:MAG: hypothetical protein Q4B26_12920 [Eubacteriales bacterium]|nr:hypothetical protein [Eubacteriales bacterium]
MNIDKKVTHYLRNSWIDFQTFYILDMIPQNKDDAVIILAPLYPEEDDIFFVWYQGEKYSFQSFDRMMDILIECGHINRRYADSLKKKYENTNTKEI